MNDENLSFSAHFVDEFVAVKIVQKSILKKIRSYNRDSKTNRMKYSTALDKVHYEIALMKKIRHPNLVCLHEVLDSIDSDRIYMVLEFMPMGQIMEFNEEKGKYYRSEQVKVPALDHPDGFTFEKIDGVVDGHFDEKHAAGFFVDIMCGLAFLHRHHICHQDLKPENILIDALGHCKITDFGVSHYFSDEGDMDEEQENEVPYSESEDQVNFRRLDSAAASNMEKMHNLGLTKKTEGTYAFFSPEMCTDGTNKVTPFSAYSADIWAAGVCFYILLTGNLPYYSANPNELFKKIKEDNIKYPSFLSEDAVDLLKLTLEKNPEKRGGIGTILSHKFVTDVTGATSERQKSLRTSIFEAAANLVPSEEEVEKAITKLSFEGAVMVTLVASKFKRTLSKKSK